MTMKHLLNAIIFDRKGNFAIITALLIPILLVCAGGTIDVAGAFAQKTHLQGKVDAAILSAAKFKGESAQFTEARRMMAYGTQYDDGDLRYRLQVVENSDGSVTGTFTDDFETSFLPLIGMNEFRIVVSATAVATKSSVAAPCIYVLASSGQDTLINSGANVQASACEMDVASRANPAFIMNSGSTLNFAKFCVRGTQYIKNGGTISNMQVGCITQPDPYAGNLPEPSVGACTDSGTKDGNRITMPTGVHCNVTFNGSPTITFNPGLHIISGRMIINSGSTVVAKGVTFYFPDTDSEIRANGSLTFTGIAPTSGRYRGILMFEKTSNNANKTQYIFNGSNGEELQGIIYLPNRNVTYNSTTNVAAQISMVVNQMIVNSANWKIQPYGAGVSSNGDATPVRLVR